MNWKTYKGMTEKQKEEYNYNVKPYQDVNVSSLVYGAVFLLGVSMMWIFVIYLFTTSSELSVYQIGITSMLTAAMTVVKAAAIWILVGATYAVVKLGVFIYRHYSFMKRYKIKAVWGWPLNKLQK